MLSAKLLIVTVTGRKTGRVYANPVGYAEHNGQLLIGTAAGWRRNVKAGIPVRVRLRGKDIEADAEVITEEQQAADLYRVILAHNPVHGRFAGIGIDPDGSPNPDDLRRALADGTAVVQLTPR